MIENIYKIFSILLNCNDVAETACQCINLNKNFIHHSIFILSKYNIFISSISYYYVYPSVNYKILFYLFIFYCNYSDI